MKFCMSGRSARLIGRVSLLWVILALLACSAPSPKAVHESISGSVWYRERIAPPPDAVLQVILEDGSGTGSQTERLAETRFSPTGGPPWDFNLAYDPAKIHAPGRYVVRAELYSGGRLMFASTENIPAFGDAPIRIMMSMTGGRQARAAAGIPDASLTGTNWKLTTIEGVPAVPGEDGRKPDLVLADTETRVKGYSGCNSFSGSYTVYNDSLEFFEMLSTMKSCAVGEEQEFRFMQALRNTRQFKVAGGKLTLMDAEGRPLLEFEAVDLP